MRPWVQLCVSTVMCQYSHAGLFSSFLLLSLLVRHWAVSTVMHFFFCICTATLSRGLCVSSYAGFFLFSFLLLFLSVRQWAMSTVMRIFFFLSNCTATLNRECSYGSFPLSVQQYSAVSTVPFLKFVQQHWAVSKVTLKKKKCTATLSCEYTYACIFQLLFFSSFFCILAATLNRYHSCEWFSL